MTILIYIDDILVYSESFEDHLDHLEKLFLRLREANLKLKTTKCRFGVNQVKFLGFVISPEGIIPHEENIKAVKDYPVPKNPKEVRRFLGLASHYRKFIPGYSTLADPINKLIKKNVKCEWTRTCDEGYKKIIGCLTSPPLLAFPDFSKQFHLATDASGVGLGAVLIQYDDSGNERVIAYASRNLRPSERNYPAIELECLAIVWACEQFRQYLYGRKFRILSDQNPLAYLENMRMKSTRIQKWRLQLAEYDKEIVYRKGSENANADALSRIEAFCVEKNDNMVDLQREDEQLKKIFGKLDEKGKYNRYFVKNNVLYKKYDKYPAKLMVPQKLVAKILQSCHEELSGGHLGLKRTYGKIRQRYLWNNMVEHIKNWIRSCKVCSSSKNPKTAKAQLLPINEFNKPFDMVGVDILGPLPETPRRNKYILIFTDYLSK